MKNFRCTLISITPEGNPVLLIKLVDMKRVADGLRGGALALADLEQHLAFMNEYMYKVGRLTDSDFYLIDQIDQRAKVCHC
jgi:hypothetical protein